MNQIRAVLLDLGDTLVHLSRPWEVIFEENARSIYEFLRGAGVKADFDKFSASLVRALDDASATSGPFKIEIPMEETIRRVMGKFGLRNPHSELVQGAIEAYYRPELQSWEVFPDTVETLINLDKSRYVIGLISNARSDWAVNAIMRKNEIEKFFQVTVTSAAMRIRKPRPEIFIKALDALDVRPREATFIGDSLDADVLGARNVGMHAIYLRRRPPEHDILVAPEATVSNLTEATKIIEGWATD